MGKVASYAESGLINSVVLMGRIDLYDPLTGRMLNPDMEFYKLAGPFDIGKIKVHMLTNQRQDNRGVIGLGEPPVISPGAAISNAVDSIAMKIRPIAPTGA